MARSVILLAGDAREETGKAAAAITPGMLLGGPESAMVPHASAGGYNPARFARENREDGGGDADQVIPSGDTFTIIYVEQGALVNAIASTAVAEDAEVTSAGDGRFRVAALGEHIVGKARTAAAAADDRFQLIIGVGTAQ